MTEIIQRMRHRVCDRGRYFRGAPSVNAQIPKSGSIKKIALEIEGERAGTARIFAEIDRRIVQQGAIRADAAIKNVVRAKSRRTGDEQASIVRVKTEVDRRGSDGGGGRSAYRPVL